MRIITIKPAAIYIGLSFKGIVSPMVLSRDCGNPPMDARKQRYAGNISVLIARIISCLSCSIIVVDCKGALRYRTIYGVIAFNAVVFMIGRFTIVTLPDGTITSDNTRVLIIYGAIFIVTLIVGGIVFFRNMTRKEIFFSASIIVAIGLIMDLTQWAFDFTTGPGAVFFMYASQIFEWSSIVPQLLYRVNENLYLFILFGKKEQV